ncbi:MAG TPA: hypothetical protein VMR41_05390 [Patescibacteria group bacterium]|nr:hypothetical protein [Patescibacteria group bacterium]
MYSQDIYEYYKPLRNHLRQLSLPESLYTLWAFSELSQFNRQLPSDIENPQRLMDKSEMMFKGHVHPWEIELLTKEVIINAGETGLKSLRKWNYFSSAVNKLKELEGYISEVYISQDNVLLEINRIAHRQFPWQSLFPQPKLITRYFTIFSQPDLNQIVYNKFGLNTEQLYLLGSVLVGAFITNVARTYPLTVDVKGLTIEHLNLFLNHFSISLKDLKEKLGQQQSFDEKFAYSFNSLRTFPIIKMDFASKPSIVCPLPTLLFWRFTSGLYYEVCNEKGFENAFGHAYQDHVGKILKKSISKYRFIPEAEYYVKKSRKDSVDWIIESDALLFIECKTRRMGYAGKEEIINDEGINNQLTKMADIIIQVYSTINDYKKGYYSHIKYNKNKQIFPLIITLEDWYFHGDKLYNQLHKFVENYFIKKNLPLEWLDEMPYSICSLDEFEEMAQIIEQVGVKRFISGKVFMVVPFVKTPI